MALKSIDDVNDNGFNDELFSIEIAYFAKNFRNFLRNSNRKTRGMNTVEPRTLGRMIPLRFTIMINLEKK